jgi:hypothetical protein
LGDAGELGIFKALDVFGVGIGEIFEGICWEGAHAPNFRRITRNAQVGIAGSSCKGFINPSSLLHQGE